MNQIDLRAKYRNHIGSVEDVDSSLLSVDLSECADSCLSLKDRKKECD